MSETKIMRITDNKKLIAEVKKTLTYDEINECFRNALDALDADDKTEIKSMIDSAAFIFKNVGRVSAIELVGKIAISEVLE